jgi:hypothetical protein
MFGPNGTAAAPVFAFSSDGNNGLYLAGTDNPAISAGGTQRLGISTTAITAALPLAMGTNKITGLGNGTAAQDAAAFSQLKVLQVVTATSTTSFNTTNTAYQAANITCSITPTSASNRIIVLAQGCIGATTQDKITYASLYYAGITGGGGGDAAVLSGADGIQQMYTATGGYTWLPCYMMTVHSPATTSAISYQVIIKVTSGGTGHFGINGETQRMTLIEVV